MTATGRTSCEARLYWLVGSRVEVPGSQPSQITKIEARNTPEANSGTDVVTIAPSEMVRSSTEPSRVPAATPRTIEAGTMIANAIAARIAVLPSRSQMMSLTGSLNRVDIPRSPCRMLPSHST